MKRVLVYCEGPTEETFINRMMAPALYPYEVYLYPSPCKGVSKYSIIRKRLVDLCRSDPNAIVTTMLDYYGIPSDTPGYRESCDWGGDIYRKVEFVEEKIKEDVGADNLIPNLLMHEFEALLFSAPEYFSNCGMTSRQVEQIKGIRILAESPEHINNDPNTAPSKRILKLYPEYSKVVDGYQIAQDTGLSVIRRECRHFDAWVQKLEALT